MHKQFATLALLGALFAAAPAQAQWQVCDHCVPVGNGAGVQGFNAATPITNGVLWSSSASADPTFTAAPILGTSLQVPLIIGGTGTTGTQLTFQTTTGNGTTDQFVWKGGNNGATTFATLGPTSIVFGSAVATLQLGDTGGQALIRVSGAATDATISIMSKGGGSVVAQNSTGGYIGAFNNNAGNTAAANAIAIANSATGNPITIGPYSAVGPDANVNVVLYAKGTGGYLFRDADVATNRVVIQAANTASSSTSTGTLVVAGGLGVSGAINSGSDISATSSGANALAVGRQGTTNPVLQVDASTASVVTGLKLKGAAAAGGMAVSVISSGTNENLTLDAKGSGTMTINGTATGGIALGQTTTVTSSNASALAAGRQGATNPVLQVDASTASVVTGLSLKGAAAAGGMAVSVISSGTNENLTIDGKGSGTVTINGTGTGAITLARDVNLSGDALLAAAKVLKVNGTQVVTGRQSGYTAMTGTSDPGSTFDTATVTLPNLAQRVKAIQASLTTHGLIGP